MALISKYNVSKHPNSIDIFDDEAWKFFDVDEKKLNSSVYRYSFHWDVRLEDITKEVRNDNVNLGITSLSQEIKKLPRVFDDLYMEALTVPPSFVEDLCNRDWHLGLRTLTFHGIYGLSKKDRVYRRIPDSFINENVGYVHTEKILFTSKNFPNLEELSYYVDKKNYDLIYEIKNFKNLRALDVKSCKPEILYSISPKLKYFYGIYNNTIEDLEFLPEGSEMEKIFILNFYKLRTLKGLERLKNLREIRIDACSRVENYDALLELPKIERVSILISENRVSLKNENYVKALKVVRELRSRGVDAFPWF